MILLTQFKCIKCICCRCCCCCCCLPSSSPCAFLPTWMSCTTFVGIPISAMCRSLCAFDFLLPNSPFKPWNDVIFVVCFVVSVFFRVRIVLCNQNLCTWPRKMQRNLANINWFAGWSQPSQAKRYEALNYLATDITFVCDNFHLFRFLPVYFNCFPRSVALVCLTNSGINFFATFCRCWCCYFVHSQCFCFTFNATFLEEKKIFYVYVTSPSFSSFVLFRSAIKCLLLNSL